LNSACFSVFSVFVLAVALKVFFFTPQAAGRLISFGGGAFVLAVFCGGFVVENIRFHKALLGSFAATILGLLLLAMAQHGAFLWAGAVVLGLAMGITNVLTIMRVSNVRGRTGQVAGFYNVSTSLGNTVGPMAGGLIGKIFGPQAVFVLFIPLFVLCAIWLCVNASSLEVYHE